MKYIDANHLKAEIKERIALQKDLLKRAEDSARIEGSIDALLGLLNSMDTLSEEPDKYPTSTQQVPWRKWQRIKQVLLAI